MKTGDKFTILPSLELQAMGLGFLSGRRATVAEVCYGKSGAPIGAWAELEGGQFLRFKEWFFPRSSISML